MTMRALVQRPRRRMHAASRRDGAWIAVCGRWIADDEQTAVVLPEQGIAAHAEAHADECCRDCGWIALLADWIATEAVARFCAERGIRVDVEVDESVPVRWAS